MNNSSTMEFSIIGKFIIFVIVFFINGEMAICQYVNPTFSGAQSSGFGESGAQLAGPLGGILNPSSLFINKPRININFITGVYSDYLLFYPTIKNISISIPFIKQTLSMRGYYGIPQENNLRNYSSNNIFGTYNKAYTGGQKHIGASLSYRLPLNKFLRKRNYFDVRVGADVARFWGSLSPQKLNSIENDYWVSHFSGKAGYRYKIGSLLYIRYSPVYHWIFSSTFQGSIDNSFSIKEFDYYNFSWGLKYYLFDGNTKSIQLGFEIENLNQKSTRKIGVGIKYNLTDKVLNSFQGGVFTTPKNAYHPKYKDQTLVWYSMGFTKTIRDWVLALSLSDALNLKLSHLDQPSSDIAKILSISLSVPFPVNKIPKLMPAFNATPEFVDLSYKKRKLVIGKEDTITLYLQYLGDEKLVNPKVFFNIEPTTGIVLLEQFIELKSLQHLDFIPLTLPIKAVPGIPSNDYFLTASLTYGNDHFIKKQINIKTTEPRLDIIANVTNKTRYWLFETPGSYILELLIENFGNAQSDSLKVNLPEELLELGLVEKTTYTLTNIKPNTTRKLRIEFKTTRNDLPPKIPITILFEENNGFSPLPLHADFVILNKSLVAFAEIKQDPFLTQFKDFDKFYILLSPDWEELKIIQTETTLEMIHDPNFPGKIVIGPTHDLTTLLAIRFTLDNITNKYEIIGLKGHNTVPIKRYFFMIENEKEAQQTLNEFSILSYYPDLMQSNKLLIGPFKDLKVLLNLEGFIKEYFKYYQIVSRYPNQVDLQNKAATKFISVINND